MRTFLAALAALLWLAVGSSAASAEERITRFLSDVQIQPDASLDVTETIDVRAEGYRIEHGILREFPTRYRGRNGSQVPSVFINLGDGLATEVPKGRVEPISTASDRIAMRRQLSSPAPSRFIHDRTTRQMVFLPIMTSSIVHDRHRVFFDRGCEPIRLPRAVQVGSGPSIPARKGQLPAMPRSRSSSRVKSSSERPARWGRTKG